MSQINGNYQNFENQPSNSLEIDIPVPSQNEISTSKYIGNHRILKKKGDKIILTLGPHCKK